MKHLILAVLLLSSQAVFSTSFEGEIKNGFFYPADQMWKIVAIKKNHDSKFSERSGLGFIAQLMLNSNVYFNDRYIAVKQVNSSGETLVNACFKQMGRNLLVSTYGRSRKMIGENFEIINKGGYMVMPFGKNLLVKIKKQALGNKFKEIKLKLDAVYNYNLEDYVLRTAPCNLTKIKLPELANKDLYVVSENGKSVILKNHSLDPATFIKYNYTSYAKEMPINENFIVQGCKAAKQQYRFATSSKNRGMFYLVGNVVGIDTITSQRCSKVTSNRMFSTSKILDLYSINYKMMGKIILPPISALRFEKWNDDYSVTASLFNQTTREKLTFLISDFHTNNIKVKRLLSN